MDLSQTTSPPALRLCPADDPFLVATIVDCDRAAYEDLVQLAVDGNAQSAGRIPGCRGGAVLTNESRERVVTLTSWDAQATYLDALYDEQTSRYGRAIADGASLVRVRTYSLLAARSSGGDHGATLCVDPSSHICFVWGEADDAPKRDGIVNYGLWETDRYIGAMNGFRSAAFLLGHDPRCFADLSQWESAEAFSAAYADPAFREHLALGEHYSTKDVSFHHAVAVVVAR